MTRFRRYGIYAVPDGALYAAGSAWLGWDSAAGRAVAPPEIGGLPEAPSVLTATPRKYGIHATMKPPFRLAQGTDAEALRDALAAFCHRRPPVAIPILVLRRIGRFLALVPDAPVAEVSDLAAATVETFEPFRAALTEAELARRRKARLSERQEALLQRWGYPYVMAEFRFHITLTGALDDAIIGPVEEVLRAHFAPYLGKPLAIRDLALVGEDQDGMFHIVHRYALTG
jgi:putative phosphonate metabolism protein